MIWTKDESAESRSCLVFRHKKLMWIYECYSIDQIHTQRIPNIRELNYFTGMRVWSCCSNQWNKPFKTVKTGCGESFAHFSHRMMLMYPKNTIKKNMAMHLKNLKDEAEAEWIWFRIHFTWLLDLSYEDENNFYSQIHSASHPQ